MGTDRPSGGVAHAPGGLAGTANRDLVPSTTPEHDPTTLPGSTPAAGRHRSPAAGTGRGAAAAALARTPLRRTAAAALGATGLTVALVAAGTFAGAPAPAGVAASELRLPTAVLVDVDGEPHVTALATATVAALRAELREDYPDARIVVDAEDGTLSAQVATPNEVEVVADGDTTVVETLAKRPRIALAEADVEVGRLDLVRVRQPAGLTTPAETAGQVPLTGAAHTDAASAADLVDGTRIVVVRVDKKATRTTSTLDADSRTRPTTQMYRGQRRVLEAGRDGHVTRRIVRTFHDGRLVDTARTVLSRSAPVDRVVAVGTAPVPAAAGTAADSGPWPRVGGGAESQNWAALAQCEASGNPRAVNPAGYYGLYQFNVGTWGSVGGSGMPHDASAAEQTYRAKLLFASRGAQPWPVCGRLL